MPKDTPIKAAKIETVYELSKDEKDTLGILQERFSQAKTLHDYGKTIMERNATTLNGIQTAVNIIAETIARKQGLVKTGKEKITLDPTLSKITVESDETEA